MSLQKSNTLNEIYSSRKTLLKYLKNLGYDTLKYENFTIAEISAMEQASNEQSSQASISQLNFEVKSKKNDKDEEKTCSVIYYVNKAMKKAVLRDVIDEYYDYDDKDKKLCSLIVVTTNVNDTNMNIVREMWEKYGLYCVLYDLASLQYNVIEHGFVPGHVKLTQEQKETVMKKYNISNDSQFPEISMFDPVAKAILMRPGDLCEITRYEKISFKNTFYRICVI
jgi:DNA-directed RNA polymerase subunit H (RpoH/RPB5)